MAVLEILFIVSAGMALGASILKWTDAMGWTGYRSWPQDPAKQRSVECYEGDHHRCDGWADALGEFECVCQCHR